MPRAGVRLAGIVINIRADFSMSKRRVVVTTAVGIAVVAIECGTSEPEAFTLLASLPTDHTQPKFGSQIVQYLFIQFFAFPATSPTVASSPAKYSDDQLSLEVRSC